MPMVFNSLNFRWNILLGTANQRVVKLPSIVKVKKRDPETCKRNATQTEYLEIHLSHRMKLQGITAVFSPGITPNVFTCRIQ